MTIAPQELDHTDLLSGEDQISWTPTTPVPAGIAVENMRRRGIDQLQITIPHPEPRLRTVLRFGAMGRGKPRSATVTFAEDHVQFIIPKRFGSKNVETIAARKDIRTIAVHDSIGSRVSSLQVVASGKTLHFGMGLPMDALHWLRERILLEAAGLVSRPLFNVGRRNTRKTSNPDHDFFASWPSGPNRLLSLFLEETPEKARLFDQALQDENWEAASQHCHWMKSTSAAVGAAQLSEICQRIEIDIAIRNYTQIDSLRVHFERDLQRVSETLGKIVRGEPVNPPSPAVTHRDVGAPSGPAEFCGMKVLLVEDSLVNQEVARCSLEDSGCITTVASDGEIAVECFNQESFDLILMDCQMPVMDGFEATRAIRTIEFDRLLTKTPIIALTANALKDDEDRCISAGMNDYLSKPYEESDLLAVLHKWLPREVFGAQQQQVCAAE